MTYDTVATISQVASLLMFVAMSLAVLFYVFLPRNRTSFERASTTPLLPDVIPTTSNVRERQ